MKNKLLLTLLSLPIGSALAQSNSGPTAVSEQDFLSEVPVVLSVSRLAQRLDETPGAVTILDRDFIRKTGARDVVDLLRLVPGFQVTTSFETDAPMASYHGRNDDWSNRIQVLVDGRSVYSGHLQSSSGFGLQTLAIDDIERIEVLRGSNSASYGARAFLGVINIISRNVRETLGVSANMSAGNNQLADAGARVGWEAGPVGMRLSADRRQDAGLRGAFGRTAVSRVNFSGNLIPQADTEIDLRMGALNIDAGRGTEGDAGNNARMRFMGSRYLQLDVRKSLEENQDLAVSLSHTEASHRDSFPFLTNGNGPLYYGIPIDFGGSESNDAVSLQHTVRFSPSLRAVWGGELRQEEVKSRSSFDSRERVTSKFSRLFGNAEWRFSSQWLLNAGMLAENSDAGGNSVSPRIMVNWQAAEGHTLRAGVSTAFRPPSAFERFANVNYYDVNGANPINTTQSNGELVSERIRTEELGYYLNLPKYRLSADVRIFNEYISDGLHYPSDVSPIQFRNMDNYRIQGMEYQLQWKPWVTTQVGMGLSWTTISGVAEPADVFDGHPFRVTHGAPRSASSFSLMHVFQSGLHGAVMHSNAQDVALMSTNGKLYSMARTDLRLAKPFRIGSNKAEIALTVQNIDVPYRDGDSKYFFDRRFFVSLQVSR
jgi:iron complex outermembrane receptor protein